MIRVIFFFCMIGTSLSASDDWIQETIYQKEQEAQNRANEDVWFKETLKKRLSELEEFDLKEIKDRSEKIMASSHPCALSTQAQEEFSFFILMTFDLPERLWIEYSRSLEKIGGAFALRGLPDDSFIELAKKIKYLKERGVNAPIQLHPKLFEKFNVDLSPTMLLIDKNKYDKMSGAVSIRYVIETFVHQGDTTNGSQILGSLLRGVH